MTQKQIQDMRELDTAAERAGGYVAMPGSLKPNPEGDRLFSIMRKYSLQHKIPMSQLTEEDYRKMGIKQ